MYKNILVPLDGTENDEALLEHIGTLAKEIGASLILIQLHRVMKAEDPFMKKIQTEIGSMGYKIKQRAEAYLPEVERSLREQGIEVSSDFLVVEDSEAGEIVKYAESKKCDLIALVNQAQTGLGRWFFSNMEEKVRRRSSLPVLMVARRKE
jgi:nucleotide-binding universal stress UspA family protein